MVDMMVFMWIDQRYIYIYILYLDSTIQGKNDFEEETESQGLFGLNHSGKNDFEEETELQGLQLP